MTRTGRGILSGYPTATIALETATPAEADNSALRIKCAVVDAIPGHRVDLLRVRGKGVRRERTLR